jgi:NADPH2:quinone reductase
MPYPRVIPHSDGSGTIDAVGEGVDDCRIGRRVWLWGAQSYRPFGTAAQLVTVPVERAVDLPDSVCDELGACLGIPGITAHRAVFVNGPVEGLVVVVHQVLGAVANLAAQLAVRGGAQVIGTVRRADEVPIAKALGLASIVLLDQGGPASEIRRIAPNGVHHVVDPAFDANVDLNVAIVSNGATIATYATVDGTPSIPFWPLLFQNVTLRLLGGDDFPLAAKLSAAAELTAAATAGALRVNWADPLPLHDIALAHNRVDAGSRRRILLAPPA